MLHLELANHIIGRVRSKRNQAFLGENCKVVQLAKGIVGTSFLIEDDSFLLGVACAAKSVNLGVRHHDVSCRECFSRVTFLSRGFLIFLQRFDL